MSSCEIKHPHSRRDPEDTAYVDLVRYAFHLLRRHENWNKKKIEKVYRDMHDHFLKDVEYYKDLDVNNQRLILSIHALQIVYFSPRQLSINRMVI